MKRIRAIEIETCCVCGEEFDKLTMNEIFTGRKKYMCQACKNRGNAQIEAKRSELKATRRGKDIIAFCEKNK